jgi:hypothetical protein
MDLDGQLTQEQFHSTPVGCIRNDFDVNEFKWEEEEDRISDAVSSDSDDSDDEQVVQMPCQHRLLPCQYQYQLRYFMLCRLRAG